MSMDLTVCHKQIAEEWRQQIIIRNYYYQQGSFEQPRGAMATVKSKKEKAF